MALRAAAAVAFLVGLQGCANLPELRFPTAQAKASQTMRIPEGDQAKSVAQPPAAADLTGKDIAGPVIAPAAFKASIPDEFGIALPASLVGSAVISNDGSGVISNDGSGILPRPGYELLDFQVNELSLRATEKYAGAVLLAQNLLKLAKANEQELFAGETVGILLGTSMSLDVLADHAELHFWNGDGDTRREVLWLSFTDAKHGQGLLRMDAIDFTVPGESAFATRFDLEKGQAEADLYYDSRKVGKTRMRLEVSRPAASGPDAPILQVRAASFARQSEIYPDGVLMTTANVLADGSAAAICGHAAPEAGSPMVFKVGNFIDAAPGAHGIFMDATGKVMDANKVSASLRAAVPLDEDLMKTPPGDTRNADVGLSEAIFNFPARKTP
jgi:hypothetical protein